MDNLYSDTLVNKIFNFLGIILRFLGFYLLGQGLVLFAFSVILDKDLQEVNALFFSSDTSWNHRFLLLSMQGLSQLIGFILLPLLYVHFFHPRLYQKFGIRLNSPKFGIQFLLAIFIILCSIPLISWMVNLNKAMDLPDFMNSVERSMQITEEQLKFVTDKLAAYSTTEEFLVTLLVFAVIPAVGEEILFRGIIQNEFSIVLKNPHTAIWLTGLLFSFMHFQFYGFFPRLFLGVTFGYLYYWSGNIIIPILVHFINNALTLIVTNLYRQRVISVDPDSPEFTPVYGIIISLILFSVLLFTFKKLKNQTP
jgi:uncharacterized protein